MHPSFTFLIENTDRKLALGKQLATQTEVRDENDILIHLDPNKDWLESVGPLWNVIYIMIIYDCFINNNPMRMKSEDPLHWKWAIISVGGFEIPSPVNIESDLNSALYTYCGEKVFLSNEECAYTTAVFYLDNLIRMSQDWDRLRGKFDPILRSMIEPGIILLRKMDQKYLSSIMSKLVNSLTEKGLKILN